MPATAEGWIAWLEAQPLILFFAKNPILTACAVGITTIGGLYSITRFMWRATKLSIDQGKKSYQSYKQTTRTRKIRRARLIAWLAKHPSASVAMVGMLNFLAVITLAVFGLSAYLFVNAVGPEGPEDAIALRAGAAIVGGFGIGFSTFYLAAGFRMSLALFDAATRHALRESTESPD